MMLWLLVSNPTGLAGMIAGSGKIPPSDEISTQSGPT